MPEDIYKMRLDKVFEGPMDLLVYLIRKNEVDIYNIPIAKITDRYLKYMELMRSMKIDFAGEFLLMAATLIKIKSRMLLPIHGDDDSIQIGLFELIDAFGKIFARIVPEKRIEFTAERISVKRKIADIMEIPEKQNSIPFGELFSESNNKSEVLVSIC
ncbi:segregation and condensation protein A [Desulfosarcina sp. BuS5]|uniref:segregation and condensation protein A n=1 Tax=Desulfosarcina sp. BuS5 TaxID=933262 RepID=UPI0006842B52|nr:segregation/condensation protein A [Desulfosarcina sp. BuS5]WDN90280.1 segregation and condensation protein A [Desulfosarcina sp. BuS5]